MNHEGGGEDTGPEREAEVRRLQPVGEGAEGGRTSWDVPVEGNRVEIRKSPFD